MIKSTSRGCQRHGDANQLITISGHRWNECADGDNACVYRACIHAGGGDGHCNCVAFGCGDGVGGVTFADFLRLAENFGSEHADLSTGDYDGDGDVDFVDFLILAQLFDA